MNLTQEEWLTKGLLVVNYRRILIDTGEANKPEYVSLLRETLDNLKAQISKVIITHWHHDHVGGLEGVLSLYPSKQWPCAIHCTCRNVYIIVAVGTQNSEKNFGLAWVAWLVPRDKRSMLFKVPIRICLNS